jgi:hypothetical protein
MFKSLQIIANPVKSKMPALKNSATTAIRDPFEEIRPTIPSLPSNARKPAPRPPLTGRRAKTK